MKFSRVQVVVLVVLVVAMVGVGAWAMVGFLGESSDEHGHDHGSDDHVEIDPVAEDPQWAAVSVMVAGLSWKPATDESTLEGFLRVGDQLTDSWRAQLEQARGKEMGTKAMPSSWPVWAASGDEVVAVVTPESVEMSSDGHSGVVDATVEQTVHHPGGETTPYSRFSAEVDVVYEQDRWRVGAYDITDVAY
ncbi:hypothetical protein [Corynebacterium oculi]|uniref:Uncharacterized protein n=1 Tax=Corynebacterium oculi TaxID=1544416 RepID=A0A0Q0YNP3_9CORY|nr:hypothetical protein [Corynebacterium oculi]KQB84068.1 hypothetical protein Cocul_00864 [Corynebacterium oculi]